MPTVVSFTTGEDTAGSHRAWIMNTTVWAGMGRYRDVQTGTDFDQATIPETISYDERRTWFFSRWERVPRKTHIRYGWDLIREERMIVGDSAPITRYTIFERWSPSRRLAVFGGYQFRPGAFLVIGTAFDLDGDPFYGDRGPVRYDGGFGRLTLVW